MSTQFSNSMAASEPATAPELTAADIFSIHQSQSIQIDTVDNKKLETYREIFDQIDKDGNKVLSLDELAETMNLFGIKAPNNATLQKIIENIRMIKTNGSDKDALTLSFEEFVIFLESQTADETIEDVILSFFSASDANRSGTLDTAELATAIQRLGLNVTEQDAATLLGGSNAEIRYEEFCAKLIDVRMDEMYNTEHPSASNAVTTTSSTLSNADLDIQQPEIKVNILAGVDTLNKVFSSEQLTQLAKSVTVKHYAANEFLARQGEAGQTMLIIVVGECEMSVESKLIAELEPGDCFGEMALVTDGQRSADLQAKNDVTVLEIYRNDIEPLFQADSALLTQFRNLVSEQQALKGWRFLRNHIDTMAKIRHVGRLARQSTLNEPEENPVSFNPSLHLDFQIPEHVYTLSELGFQTDEFTVADFAMTTPFQLLSEEGVRQLLEEINKDQVQKNCKFSSFKRAPNVLRGMAFYSTFVRELWRSPEVHELLKKVTGLQLQTHPLDYEIGHVNVQEKASPNPAEQWHTDTTPFVIVMMVTDPTGMVGGQTVIRSGKGEDIEVNYSRAGQAVILHGQTVPHTVRRAENMGRITTVTSAILDEEMVPDLSNLYVSSQYADADELHRQWAIYRFQMLNRWVSKYTENLEKHRRGDLLDGTELINQINFLMDHLKRTKNSLYANEEVSSKWQEVSARDRTTQTDKPVKKGENRFEWL